MDTATFDMVITAIGSVGFPIVACCFMGWLYVKINDTLKDLTLAHYRAHHEVR